MQTPEANTMIRVLLCAGLLLTMSACGAVRLPDADWQGRTSTLAEDCSSEASFADEADRWDPSSLQGPLRCGARAIYSVERSGGQEVSQRWEVELTAPSSPEDPEGSLRVWMDQEGKSQRQWSTAPYRGLVSVRPDGGAVEQSEAFFGLGFLRQGFVESCETLSGIEEGRSWTAEEERTLGLSYAALFAMSTIANNNRTARGLVLEIVQFPSWWTWLVPTINVSFGADFQDAVAVSTPLGPGWRFPLEVTIKGDPAFYASVTAIEPKGVLEMTAGIIEVVGFAPDQPERQVRVSLAGARAASADHTGAGPETSGLPIRACYYVE